MDRVDLVLPGQGDDAGDVEVGAHRLAGLADAVGLVRLEAVQGEAVFVRIDGHGADAQFVGRAKDANGDFAAVGDEQFANRTLRQRSLCHDWPLGLECRDGPRTILAGVRDRVLR